ncbi:MAG: AAA family ATPase [Spirochaetales bacterium]|nr:AAA family ATPase [Spirochaetales bacterium]
MLHLQSIHILTDTFPATDQYPFSLPLLATLRQMEFSKPVSIFVGENGSGKSTIIEAIARACRIHIWEGNGKSRASYNMYEKKLHRHIRPEWTNGAVPGSFFGSRIFNNFVESLDNWASTDPGVLSWFGGSSLMTQSHGQSLMSFFESRYKIKGLYILDEPETALSPKSQIRLLKLLKEMSALGHAQFILATHSPILLACDDAEIFSFDFIPPKKMDYHECSHYRLYRDFLLEKG